MSQIIELKGGSKSHEAEAPVSPIGDPRLRDAYDYWRLKAAARPMPSRADIDPIEIPKLLSDLMLVDVLPSGRYQYRLIGTGNTDAHGIDARGRYVDEVLPGVQYRNHVIALYDKCVSHCRALYSESQFLSSRRRGPERHTRVLFLPLGEDGARVSMVMVMQVFSYFEQNTRNRHLIEARPFKEITHILL